MADSRGVSDVTGLVLLLGITVMTASVALLVGIPALGQIQDQIATDRAERVAGRVAQSITFVTDGPSPTRRVEIGRTRVTVEPGRGWMRIAAGGSTLVNETLGLVRVSGGDAVLVFQGGAIFRHRGGTALVRRPPDVAYRHRTLTVSVLSVRGEANAAREMFVHSAGDYRVFPNATANRLNPIEGTSLTLTVHSRYYRAWGAFFSARMEAEPKYDPANATVSVTFVPVRDGVTVHAGVIAGTPTSTLVLSGGMSMDSYNSTRGPYAGGSGAGRVVSAGDVTLEGGASIQGGLRAGGDVRVTGGSTLTGPLAVGGNLTVTGGGDVDATAGGMARVEGNVTIDYGATFDGGLAYGGRLTDPGDAVTNATKRPVSVSIPMPRPIASRLARTARDARRDNDNASTVSVDDGHLACARDVDADGNDEECRLPAGTYYLEQLTLGSTEELRLAPDGGTVTLVVDGDVSIDGASTIRVVGDGRVNLYVRGNYTQRGGAEVVNAGEDAPQFWAYFGANATVDLNGGGRFVGVLYGPGAAIDVGSVPVYGALVGDVDFVASGVAIHYDAALARFDPLPAPSGSTPVKYVFADVENATVTAG